MSVEHGEALLPLWCHFLLCQRPATPPRSPQTCRGPLTWTHAETWARRSQSP